MKCNGTVTGVRGGIATVRINTDACGDCHACGFGAVKKDDEPVEVKAFNEAGAEKDDLVHLEVSGRKVMAASAVIFIVPFAAFIGGFLLGYYPLWFLIGTGRPLVSVITGVAFMAGSYYLVHLYGKRSRFEFVIKTISGRETTTVEPPEQPGS